METSTANQLYNALSRLGRQIHRMEHRMAHRDLMDRLRGRRGQTHLLLLISRKNGASQRDLAEEMDVRPSSMTEMLLKLERAGFITRRQDENDQRVMRIFLTEAGERAAVESDVASLDLTTALFDCLTEEEQAQLLSLVEKVSVNLETLDQPDGHGRHHHHGFHHGLRHHWRLGRHIWPSRERGCGPDEDF